MITQTPHAAGEKERPTKAQNRQRADNLGSYYYRHDENGSVSSDSTYRPVSNLGPSNWFRRVVRTYYDAAGRLAVSDVDSIPFNSLGQAIPGAFTPPPLEYRYDALGRLLIRPDGTGGSLQAVQDGHNLLRLGNYEFIQAGTDEPLMLLAPSGSGICETSTAYFVTSGNRLYDFHRQVGTSCIEPGNSGWETFGRNAGAILGSYTFGLSASPGATGLSYFRNRFYDGRTGRFTQEDPIGFGGGSNLYAYADNNPASFTDRFGVSATATDDTIDTRWKRPWIDMSDPGPQRRSVPSVQQCGLAIGNAVMNIIGDAAVVAGAIAAAPYVLAAAGSTAGFLAAGSTATSLLFRKAALSSAKRFGQSAAGHAVAAKFGVGLVVAGEIEGAIPGLLSTFAGEGGLRDFLGGFVPFKRSFNSLGELGACR